MLPLLGCGGDDGDEAAPRVGSVTLLSVAKLAVGERATLQVAVLDTLGAPLTVSAGSVVFTLVSGASAVHMAGSELQALAPGDAMVRAAIDDVTSADMPVHVILRRYSVTDLGALGSGALVPLAINASGQVCGYSVLGDGTRRAFLWSPTVARGTAGTLQDLGLPSGFASAEAADLNDDGTVVGNLTPTTGYANRGFLWQHGAMRTIDGPVGSSYSFAKAVNAAAQVLLLSNGRPYLWQADTLVNCSGPVSDAVYNVAGLNDAGTAIGIYTIGPGAGTQFGWRFEAGRFVSMGRSLPVAINNAGTMLTYQQDQVSDPLMVALNDSGQAVGNSPSGAVLVESAAAYLLDDMMSGTGSLHLDRALALNDSGQIVGTSGTRALLLTPLG